MEWLGFEASQPILVLFFISFHRFSMVFMAFQRVLVGFSKDWLGLSAALQAVGPGSA